MLAKTIRYFVCILATAAVPIAAQSLFKLPQLETSSAIYVAAGDLDGDHDIDLLTRTSQSYTVMLNQGGGRFAAGPSWPVIAAGFGTRLADLDGDGWLDLVGVTGPTPYGNGILVWHGQAGAVFGPPVHVPMPGAVFSCEPGDGNGDGITDIAVLGYDIATSSSTLEWLFGANNRQYAPQPRWALPPLESINRFACFDADGDGDDDLAFYANGSLQVLRTQAGVLAPLTQIPFGNSFGGDVVALDLDGDLDFDLVVQPSGTELRRVFNQAGTFTLAPAIATTIWLADLFAGDWDHDGDLDVVAVSSYYYTLFENDGTGALTMAWNLDTGSQQFQNDNPGLIDLDGDGNLDVVATKALLFGDGTAEDPLAGPQIGQYPYTDWDGDGDLDLPQERGVLWRNDGRGRFTREQRTWPTATLPNHSFGPDIVMADFDGDGLQEALVPLFLVQPFGVQFQYLHRFEDDGAGGFVDLGPATSSGPQLAYPAFVADTNGDGVLDIVDKHGVWVNNGSHTFTQPQQGFSNYEPLCAGDLDGDGDTDFVAGYFGSTSSLAVLEQNGPNSFAIHVIYPAQVATLLPNTPLLADLDEDGDLDIVVNSTNGNQLQLWLNQAGTFVQGPVIPILDGTALPMAADLDGDGRTDLAYSYNHALYVLHRNSVALTYDPEVVYAIDGVRTFVDLDQDGDLDAVGYNIAFQRRFDGAAAGQRRQYGTAAPGTGGCLPVLGCQGVIRSNETPVLRLRHAVGGTFSFLVGGFTATNYASAVLPGLIAYTYPFVSVNGFAVTGPAGQAGAGTCDVPFPIPPGFSGTHLYFQQMVLDSGSGGLVVHSNGLEFAIGH
jgi:hypothetical protein